ncbi:MAG: DUF1566 domain-containing protein [Tannerella sp.]|jgi:hypothetical protein|nr:DUF1566 domain-containing protein [Tannerella sp.]
MKRIALIFLSAISLMSCNDNKVDPPPPPPTDVKEVSLNIHIPQNSMSTYAGEDASALENRIDSLFINLYQGTSTTPIHQGKFGGTDLTRISDSIVKVGYEVDNITTGTLTVEVYANKRGPVKVNDTIPIPTGAFNTLFYMSGKTELRYNSTGVYYEGEVHVVRNVAKLRINVSKNSVVLPSDLEIDYSGIKVEVAKTPDSTSWFENTPLDTDFTTNSERTGNKLRPINGNIGTFNGGQIDSLYLYENLRSDSYGSSETNGTKIKITIPTKSQSEGNKTADFTYTLHTNMTKYAILRNYIYTLDIKVRGQRLDPLITLDIQPWNDVNVDGSVYGTYLTMDASEIVFDSNGEATINFCTDAQAIYFDYEQFNSVNDPQIGFEIDAVGIEDAESELAPDGFKDGQILLDKQHCGSFGFKLNLNDFPEFPAVDFSGKICVKAGNIVKCLSFPARNTYDAHFIVGDTILGGETFTDATVVMDNGSGDWLQISTKKLYSITDVSTTYTGPAARLFLHLDENLSGATRTGSIILVNSNSSNPVEKKIYISQLPAIPVGRFGYANGSSADGNIYSGMLYAEQLYEFNTRPIYAAPSSINDTITNNALYNGRYTATSASVFDYPKYTNFNYSDLVYQAINYCAQKNRISGASSIGSELKWYLPAQAQLMGMWISFHGMDTTFSNFSTKDIYWSSTDNHGYAIQAQYMDFRFGNVGHYNKSQKYWARCVRDINNSTQTPGMVSTDGSGFAVIDFSAGLPTGAYTSNPKGNNGTGDENSNNNKTVFKKLRIDNIDLKNHITYTNIAWQESVDECTAVNGGGWRLPTQRELQAIWILQHEIKNENSSFELLSDNYYWSATEASTTYNSGQYTNAYTIYGSTNNMGGSGNTPHILKSTLNIDARCVQEVIP